LNARDSVRRLEKMLARDKLKAPDGFFEVFERDLAALLSAYFELEGFTAAIESLPEGTELVVVKAKVKALKPLGNSRSLRK
jgi:hypothetical protein